MLGGTRRRGRGARRRRALLEAAAASARATLAAVDGMTRDRDPALTAAIDAYLDFLRVERGLSPATISAYAVDLRGFARHAAPARASWRRDAQPATRLSGGAVAAAARHAPGDPPAQGRGRPRLLPLLLCRGLIERDVASLLDLPRAARVLPDTLGVKEVEALLDAPDRERPPGIRDRALLELLYACGLRVSEALNLDMRGPVARRGDRARHRQGRPRAQAARG